MVAAEISPSVMTGGGTSTAMLNLSARITALKAAVDAYIAGETARAADYAHSLEIDTDNNLLLKNEAGTVLSTENLPLTAAAADYGTLVFSGTGAFILDLTKTYVLGMVGSPTVYIDVYKASENGGTGVITYTKLTTNLKGLTVNRVLTAALDAPGASDPFDGTYYIGGTFTLDGGEETFDAGWLNFGMINSSIWPALGLNSVGYYQVYELVV
jgi:hypothetical protein